MFRKNTPVITKYERIKVHSRSKSTVERTDSKIQKLRIKNEIIFWYANKKRI
jgi:hypothetical protein